MGKDEVRKAHEQKKKSKKWWNLKLGKYEMVDIIINSDLYIENKTI
jgi:hypothetical protein